MQRFGVRAMRAVAVVLLAAVVTGPLSATVQAAPPAEGRQRFIVVLRDGAANPYHLGDEVSRANGGKLGLVFSSLLRGFAIELTPQAAEVLRRRADIAYVEADYPVKMTAEVPSGVDRIEADKNPTAAINGQDTRVNVDIAILDTGISAHPDLAISGGANCTGTSCVTSNYADDNGHGTHVAGTAAALDNGAGVVGVAPGARLWAVKVLDSEGSGAVSSLIAGLDWLAQRGDIEVANMSLSCECTSSALNSAITRATNAGLVVVAAAGNDAKDAAAFSPASHPNAIAVSAMVDFDGKPGGLKSATCSSGGNDDSLAGFSNFGSVVDLAAPGVCITSTLRTGGYGLMSGTSMASPHVAGAAALYIVEKQIASSSTRWSTVRTGLRADWATAQTSACGFSGGKSSEPLLLLAPCGGQVPLPGVISGTVRDANTGQGIAGAEVAVSGSALLTTTGPTGSYSITSVPAGALTISASADGYATRTRAGTVEAGLTLNADFELAPIAAKPAIVRDGMWHLRDSLDSGPADRSISYGIASDLPLMCDWDGDGVATPGIVRNGLWYLRNSLSSGGADVALSFGIASDTPICGDWDGDGDETPGVVRNGMWYLRNSLTSGPADLSLSYGISTDKPLVCDWDGDGIDTPGIVRDGIWFLRNSLTSGTADVALSYGAPADTPICGDWDGDGVESPGIVRNGLWYLRNALTSGVADLGFSYGMPTDKPLVWQ